MNLVLKITTALLPLAKLRDIFTDEPGHTLTRLLRVVLGFLGWFGVITGLLIIVAMVRAAWGWSKISRLRTPMTFRRYLRLRWQGVNVLAVAAADWAARVSGWDVDLELWVSFAVLRVDALGAAALAGYDPLDVAQAAFAREVGSFTNEHLTQLDTWGLKRGKKPA
jgi:hypothetical protein